MKLFAVQLAERGMPTTLLGVCTTHAKATIVAEHITNTTITNVEAIIIELDTDTYVEHIEAKHSLYYIHVDSSGKLIEMHKQEGIHPIHYTKDSLSKVRTTKGHNKPITYFTNLWATDDEDCKRQMAELIAKED